MPNIGVYTIGPIDLTLLNEIELLESRIEAVFYYTPYEAPSADSPGEPADVELITVELLSVGLVADNQTPRSVKPPMMILPMLTASSCAEIEARILTAESLKRSFD